jgi:ParB-like chromosome segregation protein Spo0J
MKKTDPQIEQVPTASLVPYAKNAKKHDAAQVAAIAGSIREFGFNNPVLIDADNGIIAGHGRTLAAHQLGLATVPCLRLTHLTDSQRRAYILADNRLAEIGGGWDSDMLAAELEALAAEGVAMEDLGFDADALEKISSLEEKDDTSIDSLPEAFEVIAECENEKQQREIFEKLNEMKIKCRLSTL